MAETSFDRDEPAATLRRSVEELELKQAFNAETWSLGNTERWDVDFDEGLIRFTSPGLLVTAAVQVIGTYLEGDSTWLWGWDHPSVEEHFARDARLARDFGARYGLEAYVTRMITCAEEDARRFTALACHLAGAAGAYRGPSDTSYLFMTFHDVVIHSLA